MTEPNRVAVPAATVVIPCKDHADELQRCLARLQGHAAPFDYEILVVDSALDPRVKAVVEQFDGIGLQRDRPGLRAGEARNLGANRARGRYIAFLDADCQPEPGWLSNAVRALERGATMVGGPVLDNRPWHPVAATDNLLQFSDFSPGRENGPARYFPGCNMALRRDDLLRVGGFPPVGLTAGEDTALCERILELRADGLVFVRDMRVRHDGRTTLPTFLEHQASFGHARGALGLHLTPSQLRWGRTPWAVPAVIAKRFGYIVKRQATWNRARSLRLLPLAPLIFAGLLAWSEGFRRGCRERLALKDGGAPPIRTVREETRP